MNNVALGNDRFTYYETIGGGQGACADADGPSGVHVAMSNTLITPVEALELSYPLRVERWHLREGSGGAGAHRGGDGVVRELRVLEDCRLSVLAERRAHGPRGAAGGGDGAPGPHARQRGGAAGEGDDGAAAGDLVRIETPGGGGFGTRRTRVHVWSAPSPSPACRRSRSSSIASARSTSSKGSRPRPPARAPSSSSSRRRSSRCTRRRAGRRRSPAGRTTARRRRSRASRRTRSPSARRPSSGSPPCARELGIWLVTGVNEVETERPGTIYNALLYHAPDGSLALHHRKLVPTNHERLIWGQGDGRGLNAVETGFGRVGGLICWENYMPLARFALYESGVEIYVASTADDGDAWQSTLVHIARESRSYVVSPCRVPARVLVSRRLPAAGGARRRGRARPRRQRDPRAGRLVSRRAAVRRGGDPVRRARPGRLLAERQRFDPVGHYHRPDVLRLGVSPSARAADVTPSTRPSALISPSSIGNTSTPSHSTPPRARRPFAHGEVVADAQAEPSRSGGRGCCGRSPRCARARRRRLRRARRRCGCGTRRRDGAWTRSCRCPGVPGVVVALDQLTLRTFIGDCSTSRRTRSSPTRRVTPSASKRSSSSCAVLRPTPSSVAEARERDRPAASHSATSAPARARTPPARPRSRRRRGRGGPAPRGSGASAASSTFTGSSPSCASSSAAASARPPSSAARRAGRASRRAARGRAAARPPPPTARPAARRRGRADRRASSARSSVRAQLVEPRLRRPSRPRARRRRARRGGERLGTHRRVHGRAISPRSTAPSARRSRAAAARGSSTTAAADRRAGAQDDAVAARGDDRLARAAAARSGRRRARRAPSTSRGAVVDVDARRDLRERLERDVEPVARRGTRRARRARRRGAARARSTPGSATATRWPASARATGRSCTCTLRTRTLAPARLDAQLVAVADRARPERAGDDGADAAQREDAVDVEARRRVVARVRARGATAASAARSSSSPAPVRALTATTAAPGTSSSASARASSSVSSSTRSAFVSATTPRSIAEQAQDREVLVRLRPRALVRVDHEQEEVDAGRARDHRAHEPLVAGNVDDRELRAVRQLERRVAEVDRDAARLLLRQPVGVLARERLDERRLAVVDVAGGADRQRHRCTAAATSSTSSSASVRQSSRSFPSRTMPTTGGSPARSGAASASSTRAGEARQLGERQRAAADAGDGLLDRAAGERREPLGPRADALASSPQHAQHRDPLAARRGSSRSVPSSAASVSLSARSARWSGWRRSRSTSSARPATMPACGPPSSLSPEKQTRSAPRGERLRAPTARPAHVAERAGAEVVDERQARAGARPRRARRAAAAR